MAGWRRALMPVAALIVLAAAFAPQPVLVTGLLMAALVAAGWVAFRAAQAPGSPQASDPIAGPDGRGMRAVNLRCDGGLRDEAPPVIHHALRAHQPGVHDVPHLHAGHGQPPLHVIGLDHAVPIPASG
jgi:hypothetical protein